MVLIFFTFAIYIKIFRNNKEVNPLDLNIRIGRLEF
jgi:hypothetical protein